MHMEITVGADISKETFDVAVLRPEQKTVCRKFANKLSGFSELHQLVQSYSPRSVVVAMEATGNYGEALALFCYSLGWTVLVLNPARVKAYGIAVGQRNKTDRADSLTIAQFAQNTPGLHPWTPRPAANEELSQLVRERLHVQKLFAAEQCRLQVAKPAVQPAIQKRIALLQEQHKELWTSIQRLIENDSELSKASALIASIPGIGAWTAAVLLSELPRIDKNTSARQLAALFGLSPRQRQSGTSLRGPGFLSRAGRRVISHQLYMPAVVARRHNELIRQWAEQLEQRGKKAKQIIVAIIHRLLRIVVGVLKTQTPFQADWKGVRP
jgi:transposase